MPALSCALALNRRVPLLMFTIIDQVVVPVAVTYGPLSTWTATLLIPLPPALSCEVPETVRLPAGTVALLAGVVIVTVGGIVSPPAALVIPLRSSDRVPILPALSTAATL